MIRINSQTLFRIVNQLRLIFALSKQSMTPVTIASSGSFTTIAMQNATCSVKCELEIPNVPHQASLPVATLMNIRSSGRHEFAVRQHGLDARVSYWNGAETTVENWKATIPGSQPTAAECWLENPPQLGKVLYDYAQLTDDQSKRYALSCLQLRGRDGQVAVTDGRIAIVYDGFALPVEEALIPTEHLRGMKFLRECTTLEIGSSSKWIHLKVVTGSQRWWVDLKINCDGRFPTVDQCFPRTRTANTEVTISESDAQFILRELPKALEGDRLQPVTLIAEGTQRKNTISIRFRPKQTRFQIGSQFTELQLTTSSFDMLPRQAAINGQNLLTALQLGFRKIHFSSYPAPASCEQGNQRLVFTVFPVDFVITQSTNCLVLSSDSSLANAS